MSFWCLTRPSADMDTIYKLYYHPSSYWLMPPGSVLPQSSTPLGDINQYDKMIV